MPPRDPGAVLLAFQRKLDLVQKRQIIPLFESEDDRQAAIDHLCDITEPFDIPLWARGQTINHQLLDDYINYVINMVINQHGSPGTFFKEAFGDQNHRVIAGMGQWLNRMVIQLIDFLLILDDIPPDEYDPIAIHLLGVMNLSDDFLKSEATREEKFKNGDYRQIFGMMIVFSVAFQCLFTSMTKTALFNHRTTPFKPGTGASDDDLKHMHDMFMHLYSLDYDLYSCDIKNFDFTIYQELNDIMIRYAQQRANAPNGRCVWHRLAAALMRLPLHMLILLPDGTVWAMMMSWWLSGLFTTSWGQTVNRIMISMAAWLFDHKSLKHSELKDPGAIVWYSSGVSLQRKSTPERNNLGFWGMSNGDDCVDNASYSPDFLNAHGHIVKGDILSMRDERKMEFLSRVYYIDQGDKLKVPVTDPLKVLFNVLNEHDRNKNTMPRLHQFMQDLRFNDELPEYLCLLHHVGWSLRPDVVECLAGYANICSF